MSDEVPHWYSHKYKKFKAGDLVVVTNDCHMRNGTRGIIRNSTYGVIILTRIHNSMLDNMVYTPMGVCWIYGHLLRVVTETRV